MAIAFVQVAVFSRFQKRLDMPDLQIEVTDRRGDVHSFEFQAGSSLMQMCQTKGLPVAATCGGAKSCGTCHVYVQEGYGRVGAPDEDEADLLCESDHYREGVSRLSCQMLLESLVGNLHIELAPED